MERLSNANSFQLRFSQKNSSTFFSRRVLRTDLIIAMFTSCGLCFNSPRQVTYKRVYFRFECIVRLNMGIRIKQVVHSFVWLPRTGILRHTTYVTKNYAFKRRSVLQKRIQIIPRGQVMFILLITFKLCLIAVLMEALSFYMCLFFSVFFLFQVPLISCASPWRADERKNSAFPQLKSLLL
jgi:hypothetical protein